jgi:hypothetical protein
MLPFPQAEGQTEVRWFSSQGCVVYRGEARSVYIGGALVSTFSASESGLRNVLLVQLSGDARVHLGHLAAAFDVTEETLRLLRRLQEKDGIEALWKRHWGGKEPKVTAKLRAKLDKMFEEGCGAREAHGRLRGKPKLGFRTVQRELYDWRAKKSTDKTVTDGEASAADRDAQQKFVLAEAANDDGEASQMDAMAAAEEGDTIEEEATIAAAPVRSAALVQHAGTWLMIAMVHKLGLYARAAVLAEDRVENDALRIALDATVAALAIGQRCVEGTRRLATQSAPTLLRSTRAPSASWVRRTLGLFSQWLGGLRLHTAMAAEYARAAAAAQAGAPVVFYVDNHLRPYTGQHVIRKGWRMQDKHVVAGVTDYYVHDVDGRPILRLAVPHHGSLTSFLSPIAQMLRALIGTEQRILLAFDRAGSFPEQMAELREQGFEFVTYERRPYSTLASIEFTEPVCFGDEIVHVAEAPQRNLRGGRGRVRRVCVRKKDGAQINILAISAQPAAWLVGVMKGRWNQENAFKHGVERWGINQLDGRTVEPYPPDAIIPNPARRRLDVALRAAREQEGAALRELAHLAEQDHRRERLEQQLLEARRKQAEFERLRPSVPKHAPVRETELADKLMRHRDEYKITLDTLRIACANVEADLAGEMASNLTKPDEAKRVVANLLAAPGRVRTTDEAIVVTVSPAANGREQTAIDYLLATVNGWNLTLPGDARGRPLRFRAQF